MAPSPHNKASLGIFFVLIAILAISVNDMLIKKLSGGYALHEIVFIRSMFGLLLTLPIVYFEGGWRILKTRKPLLHATRGLLIVAANMSYFAALAALPLAEATALFFAAPLIITLLSIPLLGERVGPLRMSAVVVGFIGVLIMQRPWANADSLEVSRIVLLLPLIAAITYALNQLLTRKLGIESKASALTIYVHLSFIGVAAGFFLIASKAW